MRRKMNRIKDVLDKQGRTQAWLARQIDRTPAAVNALCQNKTQPNLRLIFEIAELLSVDPRELVGDGSEIELKKK